MSNLQNMQQNQMEDDLQSTHTGMHLAEAENEEIVSTYQYHQNISHLAPQCPPLQATETNKECWRFTLNPLTERCFWPPKKRNPVRVASDESQECSMWALSMYESEAQAVNAYSMLSNSIKNIKKVIGDHLSRGAVTVNDGKCMPPNRKGHFDFHPYSGVNFSNEFQVIRQLP